MTVLGIETSCDETAAAVVDDDRTIWSMVYSQLDEHAFGGVVPKLPLGHLECWMAWSGGNVGCGVVSRHRRYCGHRRAGVDRRVIVGTMTAKAMAAAANKPYVAVNHLEGHALTAR